MDASCFPPRLDLFKAIAARLVSEEEGPPLGPTWLGGFLNRHPELSSKFASGLNRQRALSSKPGPIKDYFQKLQMLLRKHNFLPHNIYNIDEKSFLLGMSNQAKVIVRRGRGPPRETEDGSQEWITVVETCCANTILPPMVIYQGKGLSRGWFDADDEYANRTAIFAHNDKGFTTNELATRRWDRNKAMEDMPGAPRAAPAPPRNS